MQAMLGPAARYRTVRIKGIELPALNADKKIPNLADTRDVTDLYFDTAAGTLRVVR